ncbi:hypothetical protein GHJ84_08795 [Sinorhizobium meliloti]|nr:hypothetical protein [Sinorhizobium meliloti]
MFIKAILIALGVFAGVLLAALAVEVAEYGSGLQLLLICSAAIILSAVAAWTGWNLFKRR